MDHADLLLSFQRRPSDASDLVSPLNTSQTTQHDDNNTQHDTNIRSNKNETIKDANYPVKQVIMTNIQHIQKNVATNGPTLPNQTQR